MATESQVSLLDQILAISPETYFKGDAFGGGRSQAEQLANFLSASGITDLNQFGVRAVPIDPGNPEGGLRPEYYNKATGKALASTNNIVYAADVAANYDPNISSREWKDVVPGQNMAFGQTWEGPGSTTFNVMFDAAGRPLFNTYSNSTSSAEELAPLLTIASLAVAPYLSGLIGGATGLTGAALTGATGATIGGLGSALTGGDPLKGALLGGLGGYIGGSVMGSGTSPDLGMNSNLTMAQIESGLGTPGYGYGAQAASSGLFNPASIGAGAYMDFNGVPTAYAPDNIDIGGGYNPATGMSGDIPQADYSNEGRNYPTVQSTQGSGGSPINASMAATAAGTGLTASQIAQLTKAGLGLLGAGVAGSALSGGMGGAGSIPTQRAPEYSPGYYQDIQRYYDAYMPAVPRDVVSPLQSWYGTGYSGSALTPAITPLVAPAASPSVASVAPASSAPAVTPPVSASAPTGQGLFTVGMGATPYIPPKPVDPMEEQKAMEEARKRTQEQLAMRAALRAANAGQPNYFTLSQGDPNAGIGGITGKYYA